MLKRMSLAAMIIGLAACLGLAAVWTAQAISPVAAEAQSQAGEMDASRTITVVGHGSASTSPDIAQVSIGLETSAATVSEAVAENTAQMEAILAAVADAGVDPKDIQTMNYSIHTYQDGGRYPVPAPQPEGGTTEASSPKYRVSNMAKVTIRAMEKVSAVLDAAIEAGANTIWGVTFELEDQAGVDSIAREKAMEHARARAQALADLAQVELGPVMSVSEVIGDGSFRVPIKTISAMAGGGAPISHGEVDVTYEVEVTYFIAGAATE